MRPGLGRLQLVSQSKQGGFIAGATGELPLALQLSDDRWRIENAPGTLTGTAQISGPSTAPTGRYSLTVARASQGESSRMAPSTSSSPS